MGEERINIRQKKCYVREHYRTIYGLVQFAGNYSNNKKYASTNWLSRSYEAM